MKTGKTGRIIEMVTSKIARKILTIIVVTMIAGFSFLGIASLWFEYNATMEYSIKNARSIATIIINGIFVSDIWPGMHDISCCSIRQLSDRSKSK